MGGKMEAEGLEIRDLKHSMHSKREVKGGGV